MSLCGGSSLFGPSSQYIKTNGGDFISIEGANTRERLVLSGLRLPYKQILKSRIILKAGQVNYLLNHLGLGDNVTFLAIKAVYDPKSVIEEDNYIAWNYYDDFTRLYNMGQLMILTGNSSHRIKQIYLTNPNTKYPVTLEVMAAVIDDEFSFFEDTVNQFGLSFVNLTLSSIETYIPDDSIVIYDNNVPRNALAYILLSNVNSINRVGKLLVIDDSSVGTLFLDFQTEYDAMQANSLISYVLENTSIIIQDLDPVEDDEVPVIYFYSNVDDDPSGATISLFGSTASPVDTSMGFTFSTTIGLTAYGTGSTGSEAITKSMLLSLLIDEVVDNRDGDITLSDSNIILYDYASVSSASILDTGTYSLSFVLSDIAGNEVSTSIKFEIYII